MKVARTVLNGESGSNAADLHNIRVLLVYFCNTKISEFFDMAKPG